MKPGLFFNLFIVAAISIFAGLLASINETSCQTKTIERNHRLKANIEEMKWRLARVKQTPVPYPHPPIISQPSYRQIQRPMPFEQIEQKIAAAEKTDVFVENIAPQKLYCFENKRLVKTFLCSGPAHYWKYPPGGKPYYPYLDVGVHFFQRKFVHYRSDLWNCPMNLSVFWTKGRAVHATIPEHFGAMGSADSGGCLRLFPANARWHFRWIDSPRNCRIIIAKDFPALRQLSPEYCELLRQVVK